MLYFICKQKNANFSATDGKAENRGGTEKYDKKDKMYRKEILLYNTYGSDYSPMHNWKQKHPYWFVIYIEYKYKIGTKSTIVKVNKS